MNREERSKANRKARLAVARLQGSHTRDEWLRLVAEFGGRCVRCGTDNYRVERDHIIPIYQGGADSIDNIQPLCARCNASKGPETFDWKTYRRKVGFD